MSSRFLKIHIFGFIFSFRLISIKETVLNSIKTLKRYCEVTLIVFFNKKIFDDDKKNYLYNRFLYHIEILLLNM